MHCKGAKKSRCFERMDTFYDLDLVHNKLGGIPAARVAAGMKKEYK